MNFENNLMKSQKHRKRKQINILNYFNQCLMNFQKNFTVFKILCKAFLIFICRFLVETIKKKLMSN